MTVEQIQQRILDKKSQITSLEKDIVKLEKELCDLSPYQPGDKVKLTRTIDGYGKKPEIEQQIVYVNTVNPPKWKNTIWDYTFNKPKKDGTMGGQGAGIYWGKEYTIEKVTE